MHVNRATPRLPCSSTNAVDLAGAEENLERVVLQKLDLVGDLLDAVLQNLLHRLALAAVRRGSRTGRALGGRAK